MLVSRKFEMFCILKSVTLVPIIFLSIPPPRLVLGIPQKFKKAYFGDIAVVDISVGLLENKENHITYTLVCSNLESINIVGLFSK